MNTFSFFEKHTDADSVNRGFYFQYLNTLKSWLEIHSQASGTKLYCEVEDDVKKIMWDGSLLFSQFKCYSSSFSLNSIEVQKSFYNFYFLFYKYENYDPQFQFYTNSSISTNEEVLIKWNRFQDNLRVDHLNELINEIQPIIEKLFANIAAGKIAIIKKQILALEKKKYTRPQKEIERLTKIEDLEKKAEDISKELIEVLKHIKQKIRSFISRVKFSFLNTSPEDAIADLEQDCLIRIKSMAGLKHTEKLFFSRLLTEIYQKSSNGEVAKRLLDKDLLQKIAEESIADIKQNSNSIFETILNEGFSDVKKSLVQLHLKVDDLGTPANQDGLILDTYEPERILEQIKSEKSAVKTEKFQSNLEKKINDIDWKTDEDRQYLIENATDLRCRYAIYMEELNLSGQKNEYNALRSLEKQIKNYCIQAVEKYGIGESFESRKFWADFGDELISKIREFSKICKINLQESFVFAQMYQIAAECQLRWVSNTLANDRK